MKQILKRVTAFSASLALSLSSLAILAVPSAHAAAVSKTWIGSDGAGPNTCDNNFSTGACWSPAGAPDSGAPDNNTYTLIFDDTSDATNGRTPNNDIAGLKIDSIEISGAYASDPYVISGTESITMTAGASITDTSTAANADHTIDLAMTLEGGMTIDKGTNVDGVLTFTSNITTFTGTSLTFTSTTITDSSVQEGKIVVSSVIDGDGAIVVTEGAVHFSGVNTYSGITTIQDNGLLALMGSNLGATTAGTVIESGGSVKIVTANNVADEPFSVAGAGNAQAEIGNGAIISAVNGATINAGKVTLTEDAAICAVASASIDLLTPSTEPYTLFKMPDGTAGEADDCTGAETLNGGDTLGDWSGGGGGGGTVSCATPTPIADGATDATVADGTCAQIGSGSTVTPAGGTMTVTGTLINNGTIDGDVVVDGTLMGSGDVTGSITVNSTGSLAPGNSPGCITSGNLTMTGSFDVEIQDETTPCTDYDQATVTGAVDVSAATLNATSFGTFDSSTFTVGQELIIIDNDTNTDAVTGTFSGYAEGADVVIGDNTVGTVTFTISYAGGDGNDVTLTVADTTAPVATPTDPTATPTATPGTPDTGFGAMLTNPAAIMLSTTSIAGAILAIARKYNLLKG